MDKCCITCHKNKPLSMFYFRKDTNKYRNQCKRCRQDMINLYRRESTEHKKRYNISRKNRRETDPNYLLRERLRARIRKVLKCKNIEKCDKSVNLLGCSIETFKKYIESNFKGNMCWEKRNFVLDHIIPCSSFDLSKPEEQR